MGQCDLCGESAGWFHSRHESCNTKAERIKSSIHDLVLNDSAAGKSFPEIKSAAEQLAAENKLPIGFFRETLLQAADAAAQQAALKSPIKVDELNRLVDILQGFGIDAYTKELPQRKWFGMPYVGMSCTLWQVLNNITPYYDGQEHMDFNLQGGEEPIFGAGKVTYAEERTVNTSSRTFSGVSLPIGAGAYYHFGGSQGHTVSGLMPLDVGEMLITNRTLYFGGQARTLRIPLASVIRYQSYVDGVGVCESHGAPKVFVPDYSGMDTGWFFFNLLSAITSKLNQA